MASKPKTQSRKAGVRQSLPKLQSLTRTEASKQWIAHCSLPAVYKVDVYDPVKRRRASRFDLPKLTKADFPPPAPESRISDCLEQFRTWVSATPESKRFHLKLLGPQDGVRAKYDEVNQGTRLATLHKYAENFLLRQQEKKVKPKKAAKTVVRESLDALVQKFDVERVRSACEVWLRTA